jgi:vitamin B12 transporter
MHRSFSRTALAVIVSNTFCLTAHAADAPPRDAAAIVVTATRQPMRASELISDISVIEREDIARAGQATLAEFLATQPGVQITEAAAPARRPASCCAAPIPDTRWC